MCSSELSHPVDYYIYLSTKKQELLNTGFIRNNTPKHDMLLTSVIYIINEFAEFVSEQWNEKMKSRHIIIDNLSITMKKYTGFEQSAYCTKSISSGRHKWKFRFDSIKPSNWNYIGIWKISNGDPPLTGSFLNLPHSGYAFCGPQQCLNDPELPRSNGQTYGEKACVSGDIIEMILDLDNYKLSYIINEKDQGIAFENVEPTEYKVAVTLYEYDDKISLISYQAF